MPREIFLFEEKSENSLQNSIKEEIIDLHRLGITIDEIEHIVWLKFKRRLGINKIINFLFSSV